MGANERLAAVAIGALFAYVIIEYVAAQRARFVEWRSSNRALFARSMRDKLMREEMTDA